MNSVINHLKSKFYIIMLVVAAASVLMAWSLPVQALSQVLSISILAKELIMLLIPLIIFSCSYQCMYKLNQYGILLLILMVALIMASNFTASWVGFSIAKGFIGFLKVPNLAQAGEGLLPAWQLGLPSLIGNEKALIAGIILGLSSRVFGEVAGRFNEGCKQVSAGIMNYLLLPMLPLFMGGFLVKMVYDGLLQTILQQCGMLAVVLIGSYAVYLSLGFLVAAKGNVAKAKQMAKNVIGAGWIGFSTMSSLAALPLNLEGSAKNTKHKDVVGGVLPISTNVHLVGDSIAIPVTAMLMMVSFLGHWPTLPEYAYFAGMLVLAKFSVAAVPGGGILVILPVIQSVFGFDAQSSALLTMTYILLDPIITCANILGNSLLAIFVDRIWDRMPMSAKQGSGDAIAAPDIKGVSSH